MIRRMFLLGLTAGLIGLSVGCRSNCGHGWFTSSNGSGAPCQLVGRSSDVIIDSTGAPVGGVPLVPEGGAPGSTLPFPQPNGLIPPTGVPVQPAIPSPAPGDGGSAVLPAPKFGTPVKTTK